MTDKEIYKARAGGFERIANIHSEVSDSSFLEFMSLVREVAEQYKPSEKYILDKILEKSRIRKELNLLFNNERL